MRKAWAKLLIVLGAGVLVAAAIGLPQWVIPARWAFDVTELRYDAGDVIQARDVLVDGTSARWRAWVDRIAVVPESDEMQAIMVCHGRGDSVYHRRERPVRMSLEVWVGMPCDLQPGTAYRLRAQWTYTLGIWSWTVRARSEPFYP